MTVNTTTSATTNPPPIGTIGGNDPTGTVGTSYERPATASDDKDMFLKLLLAQLKNQSPDSPVDSSTMLTQMAQFTQVEDLETLSSTSTSMLASSQLQSAVSMVGDTVSYGAGDAATSGKVTGVTVVSGVPQLLIGTDKVALTDVTGVTAPAPPTVPTVPKTK